MKEVAKKPGPPTTCQKGQTWVEWEAQNQPHLTVQTGGAKEDESSSGLSGDECPEGPPNKKLEWLPTQTKWADANLACMQHQGGLPGQRPPPTVVAEDSRV